MNNNLQEIYFDVEKSIDYAFDGRFVMKFYDYLKIRGTKKVEVEKFLSSPIIGEIADLIVDLDEYLEGGSDNLHKQLREGYSHIPKPVARSIRKYLQSILDDANQYNHDKRRGRRKKETK